MSNKKILIGGQALVNLGSSRSTEDTDYLVYDKSAPLFSEAESGDQINAAKHPFFKSIWDAEKGNDQASPAALLELKAFAFVQHCQNFNWQKADDCEYDIKFLVRRFGVKSLDRVAKHLASGELAEVQKVINSVLEQKVPENN